MSFSRPIQWYRSHADRSGRTVTLRNAFKYPFLFLLVHQPHPQEEGEGEGEGEGERGRGRGGEGGGLHSQQIRYSTVKYSSKKQKKIYDVGGKISLSSCTKLPANGVSGISRTVIRFVWVSARYGTCTVESVNWTLVAAKMCTFTLESTHFIFDKCPIYTHDGVSAKFSINSHETVYSVVARPTLWAMYLTPMNALYLLLYSYFSLPSFFTQKTVLMHGGTMRNPP